MVFLLSSKIRQKSVIFGQTSDYFRHQRSRLPLTQISSVGWISFDYALNLDGFALINRWRLLQRQGGSWDQGFGPHRIFHDCLYNINVKNPKPSDKTTLFFNLEILLLQSKK